MLAAVALPVAAETTELVNLYTKIEGNTFYLNADGSTSATGKNFYTSDYIPVTAGSTLYMGPCVASQDYQFMVYGSASAEGILDSPKRSGKSGCTVAGTFQDGSVIYSYAVETGVTHIRVSAAAAYADNFLLTQNQPFSVMDHQQFFHNITPVSTNLYSNDTAEKGYVNEATLKPQGSDTYRTSAPITVAQGDVLYWGPAKADESYQCYFWDSTGAAVRVAPTHENIELVESFEDGRAIFAFTCPDSGSIRVTNRKVNSEKFVITQNEVLNVAAYNNFWDRQASVLQGESALFAGDSICYGSQDDGGLSGWAGRIAKYYGLSFYKNNGVSGTSLSTARDRADGTKTQGRIFWQIAKEAAFQYDYVILHGGVNDAWDSYPVGEMTNSFELKDFDTDTYAGGLEELFYYAKKYHGESAIGYIMNFKAPNCSVGKISDMSIYFTEAKKICEKWGIPYLDLYNNADVTAAMTPYLANDTNKVHPNGKGYEYLAPIIAEWMETLKPAAQTAAEHSGTVIACVGDSITKGEQSTDVHRYSYPEYLQNMLGNGYDVLNFGWGGATAQETTSNPYKKTMVYKESLRCDPDIVIVMLGTNDAKTANWDTAYPVAAKAKYKADLKELVSEYQALASKPTVYLASPARIEQESNAFNAVFDGGMVAAVEEVAEELNCTYIDINELTKNINDDYYADDGCHLINAGYEVLAGHMYQALMSKAYVAPTLTPEAETNPEMPLMRNYEQYPDATQYRLETVADVEKFGDLMASGTETFAGKTVYLMNDIDFADHHFRPLGYVGTTYTKADVAYNKNFQGTFDGQYHAFSNVKITCLTAKYYGVGLFPATKGATIRNFGLKGGFVKSHDVIGSIGGYCDYGTKFINVWSSMDVFAASNSGINGSAGLASNMRDVGSITNVAYYGTMSSCADAAGLVAWGQATLVAKNCIFAGNLEMRAGKSGVSTFVRYNGNVTGKTANLYVIKGNTEGALKQDNTAHTALAAAAYSNGAAAYQLNAIDGAVWTVKGGYTIPWGTAATETHKVTVDNTDHYTDHAGKLLAEISNDSGYWRTAEKTLFTATSVFAEDTVLTSVERGDVNLNSSLELSDVICVLQHLVGYAGKVPADSLADLNKDSRVSIFDAVLLLKKVNA